MPYIKGNENMEVTQGFIENLWLEFAFERWLCVAQHLEEWKTFKARVYCGIYDGGKNGQFIHWIGYTFS
jgi:hypothetical protein